MRTDAPKFRVVSDLRTDVGCLRETNEDAGRAITPGDETLATEKGALVVVADGMGGHSAGEVASRLAVECVVRTYYGHRGTPDVALRAAFAEANRSIFDTARADKPLEGMGTTCTALAIRGDEAFCAHVGDSRLYLVRGAAIYRMTEDDSAVRQMVVRGLLTAEAARRHADRNVLLRALGTHASVDVFAWAEPLPLRAGDRFLLCSDGLHDLVEDEEIRTAVALEDPGDACRQLVELARTRGGHDNITVAVTHVIGNGQVERRPGRETRQARAL